jgi:hypothetical protein
MDDHVVTDFDDIKKDASKTGVRGIEKQVTSLKCEKVNANHIKHLARRIYNLRWDPEVRSGQN